MPESARRILALLITVVLAGIVMWGLIVGEPSEEDRVQALGARLKCPVCQGESIAESPSTYAKDILAFVEERVADGWSDDQIVTYLEERFAGIHLDPAFSGATLLLWLLPVAAIVGGVVMAGRRTRASSAPE